MNSVFYKCFPICSFICVYIYIYIYIELRGTLSAMVIVRRNGIGRFTIFNYTTYYFFHFTCHYTFWKGTNTLILFTTLGK